MCHGLKRYQTTIAAPRMLLIDKQFVKPAIPQKYSWRPQKPLSKNGTAEGLRVGCRMQEARVGLWQGAVAMIRGRVEGQGGEWRHVE